MNIAPNASLLATLSRLAEQRQVEAAHSRAKRQSVEVAKFKSLTEVDDDPSGRPQAVLRTKASDNDPARRQGGLTENADTLLRREAPAAGAKPQLTIPGQILDITV